MSETEKQLVELLKHAEAKLDFLLSDIEKRIQRLERAAEKPAITWRDLAFTSAKVDSKGQWCHCGRDVCRAPDCPSHKPDPLGR